MAPVALSPTRSIMAKEESPKPLSSPAKALSPSRGQTPLRNGHVPSPSPVPGPSLKYPLHIEVRLKSSSSSRFDTIKAAVAEYMMRDVQTAILGHPVTGWEAVKILRENVASIMASESSSPVHSFPLSQASLQIHVYSLFDTSAEEFASSGVESDEQVTAASICPMPNESLEGLWESLIYTDDIKNRLLNYIYATILFSDADVDTNIVAWNRVVLLHGPPGTGKTSLCRALGQKLSIRLSDKYQTTQLIEINSHSLFSRWFSESGKLVQALFASVQEACDDDDTFVVVLIDEVESLTAARAGSISAGEPTDALRVVNALLTQLDKLKQRKNVLVVTTSNLPKAIDSAFTDRADIIQYIGLPPKEGVYWILRGCLMELVRAKIVSPVELMDWKALELDEMYGAKVDNRSRQASERLFSLSGECQGMSGRSLRRLPVLAHARYIGGADWGGCSPEVEVWLEAMERVIREQGVQRGRMEV